MGGPSPFIAVYHDDGTGEFSRGCLVAALAEAFGERAQVRRILASEIAASDDWHTSTRLLVFPGGADRPYAARLNGAGNASIRRYVSGGGSFLGICAGAYYACARIAFRGESPGAVIEPRELALFPGAACGSLHDLAAPYATDHLRCAALASLHAPATGEYMSALYWGGPELVPDPDATFTPLLTFASPTARPRIAALAARFGAGRVVLSGVHAEISGQQFPIEVSRHAAHSFEHGMRVSAQLAAAETQRRRALGVVLRGLELPLP